eukprot:scaffold37599_cov68-Cyclotella_meneghiniana.AAC.3
MEPFELEDEGNDDEIQPLTTNTGSQSRSTGSGSSRPLGNSLGTSQRSSSTIRGRPIIVPLLMLTLIPIGMILMIRGKYKASVISTTTAKDISSQSEEAMIQEHEKNKVSCLSNATKQQISSALSRYFSDITEISKHVVF